MAITEHARFAYAQARLQARHGQRPTEATWRMLSASKSLGHYLESARQTGLAPWVTHLGAHSDIHTIEAELRRDWRNLSERVAHWVPAEWRAAVAWTGELADLPFHDDAPAAPVLADWLARFRDLWPRTDSRDVRELDALVAAFGQQDTGQDVEGLRATLLRTFRQSARRAPAAFAFLGLTALDLLQLRADLVRRSLFPERMEG